MAPEGLVEVRVSWPGHPCYLKNKKKKKLKRNSENQYFSKNWHRCLMPHQIIQVPEKVYMLFG